MWNILVLINCDYSRLSLKKKNYKNDEYEVSLRPFLGDQSLISEGVHDLLKFSFPPTLGLYFFLD